MDSKYDNLVFTDGSSRGNPGPGGWGTIIASPTKVYELGGRESNTTNNRMELTAALEALRFLRQHQQQDKRNLIVTDSSYVKQGATKWIYGWQQRQWLTSQKQPVLNQDLWEALAAELSVFTKLEWRQVRGHVGVPANERADEIATLFADDLAPALFGGLRSQYPIPFTLPTDSSPAPSTKSGRAYAYVSLVDGQVVEHSSWAECEKRVKGKKGARYRKVFSAAELQELKDAWQQENH